MKLSDPFKISYRSLKASKRRFFLTVLGVVIGVAAVIMVMATGASAQKLVLAQVESVGSNLLGILPGAPVEKGPPAAAFGVVTTTFKNDDLTALRERQGVPHITAVSGYVTGSGSIESAERSLAASFQGVSSEMIDIENVRVGSGRFFFPEEENKLTRVMVLGAAKAEELFPNSDPIGETVTLKKIPFKIIGVLAERGASAFSNPDNMVYVPLQTAQKLLLGIAYLNFARAKVDAPENIERTIADVESLLRARHNIRENEESDFSIRSTAMALDTLTNVTNVLKYFLIAIAGISLLVGGIGIMNSMLIAVSQRVREIGLRKAVGARKGHIIFQFLIESLFITVSGGVIGIVLGIAVTYIASLIIVNLGYEWQFLVPPSSIVIGFSISLIVGITFGLYPAVKASRVSPMEALRYE